MNEEKKKSGWLSLVVTTIIGIIATIAVAWYQTYSANKQSVAAEIERAKSIKSNIVSIVEDYVINEKPIDIGRIIRMIDLRRKEEDVSISLGILEVVEKAEFNIMSSRYLDIERKQNYNKIFDNIYTKITSDEFKPIPNSPYLDLTNELAKNIQNGSRSDALKDLNRLVESYQKDLEKITARSDRKIEFINVLISFVDSNIFIIMGAAYLLAGLIAINKRRILAFLHK